MANPDFLIVKNMIPASQSADTGAVDRVDVNAVFGSAFPNLRGAKLSVFEIEAMVHEHMTRQKGLHGEFTVKELTKPDGQ